MPIATSAVAQGGPPPSGTYIFTAPTWQAIGPAKIPNAHACDNGAESSLLAAGRIQAFAINLSNPNAMFGGGGVGTGTLAPAVTPEFINPLTAAFIGVHQITALPIVL